MPPREDYSTTSLCPTCLATVPARIADADGGAWLERECPACGPSRDLLEEDGEWYRNLAAYAKEGTPCARQTPVTERGCPHDCGLCDAHEQHTCIGLLEITQQCDLGCPVCFAESGGGTHLDMPTIARMLDFFVASGSSPSQVLQISGGEPTTHPQVFDIIRLARAKGVRYVMLNTNGLRIAEDEAFAAALGEFHGGFEVYLQFDGFGARVGNALRGRDLSDIKARALHNLRRHNVPAMLVCTVAKSVNDDELGAIVAHALQTPGVRGVNFQPLAFFGRHDGLDPARRITLTGVLNRLDAQMGGMLRKRDFIPLPCDPDRVAITLLYRHGGGFTPITRRLDVRKYLPLLDNTLAFYPEDVAARMKDEWRSAAGACRCLSFLGDCLPVLPTAIRGALSGDRVEFATENVFRVVVTSFLDRYSFEGHAMRRECVHVLTPDLRKVPFSAYNLLHRRGSVAEV